jgi:glycine betaine/proline transport system permease protein
VATVTTRRLPLDVASLRPRVGRPHLVLLVVAVMVVAYQFLANDFPWPSGLVIPLQRWMDELYNWIVDNQNTSPIFIYFFNPISNFLDWLVTSLTDLLDGMTWIGVTFAGAVLALRHCGWRVTILVVASFLSFGLMGLWDESMQTLALMAASVAVSLVIGIPLGVVAGLNDRFLRAITPVLDAMQIVPAFAYLMPVVVIFSVGAPAAVIATVVYAVPPAVRITALGIRGVSTNAVEAAESMGSTRLQVLHKVQLPLARRTIMLGVNQTIMMALSMVVIASIIGGAGLGDTVINALTKLDVGQAAVGGAAIVIMAIALDRATAAAGLRADRTSHHLTGSARRRLHWLTLAMLPAIVVVCLVARAFGVTGYPDTVTIGNYVYNTSFNSQLTSWIDSATAWAISPAHFIYPITSTISDDLVSWLLQPLSSFMIGTPWWLMIAGASLVALFVAGVRQAITAGALLFVIGVIGVWSDAMDTASQVLVATALTLVIGIAVGIWAAESPVVERILRPILDTLQTLPQLVYLVPTVALFNVGRVPGVIASVLYASPVVIRLVTAGLRDVSANAVEAAASFGATRWQLLRKVKLPLARPAIMLGVNQGIIMVLAVVIVAGLVGGGGLGYDVVVGLQRNEFGEGVVASIAILCLGIILDRITQTGARVRTERRP